MIILLIIILFFFNDTATTEIYTLSLHDALPIYAAVVGKARMGARGTVPCVVDALRSCLQAAVDDGLSAVNPASRLGADRKSTRLNSSHANISYAVFCLKKKNKYAGL